MFIRCRQSGRRPSYRVVEISWEGGGTTRPVPL